MKRVIALVLLSIFVLCNTFTIAGNDSMTGQTAKEIHIKTKGEYFCFDEIQPIIKNGRVLVPLQCGIFETFSATTDYDHIYKEVVIRTDTHILTLYTDQLEIYNKGEKCYELDVGPEYRNGQVYVPLRGFMESLGWTVEYDGETNTARIL